MFGFLFLLADFGFVFGLLLLVAFFGALFDPGFSGGNGFDPVFTAGNFFGQAHAVRDGLFAVRRFGHRHEFRDFTLELFFQLPGMPVTQGAVFGGVGFAP